MDDKKTTTHAVLKLAFYLPVEFVYDEGVMLLTYDEQGNEQKVQIANANEEHLIFAIVNFISANVPGINLLKLLVQSSNNQKVEIFDILGVDKAVLLDQEKFDRLVDIYPMAKVRIELTSEDDSSNKAGQMSNEERENLIELLDDLIDSL